MPASNTSVIKQQRDPNYNSRGISEDFLKWTDGKFYEQGYIVEYQNAYYRITESHTSTGTLDSSKTTKLAELPKIGGVRATFAKIFNTDLVTEINYGTTFNSLQEVVDFMLGYGKWLEEQGFVFDNFDGNEAIVQDWSTVQSSLCSDPQRWDNGTLLTVSESHKNLNLLVITVLFKMYTKHY